MGGAELAAIKQRAAEAPDNLEAWLAVCAVAERFGDYAEILRAGDNIVRLAPQKPESWFIRGLALGRLGRIEEAAESYKKTLALDPDYVDGWINLGDSYQALNKIDEAERACRKAIAASGQEIANEEGCETAEEEIGSHYWNLAIIELLKGDLPRGFSHYRARFKAIAGRKRPDFPQPLWRGEDPRGKTILVIVDQGYGDTLLSSRFLPLLKARGARVILLAQPALVSLFKGWAGADQILEWGKDSLSPFDYHASEFDLPRLLGATVENVGKTVPYLPLLPPDEITKLEGDGRKKIGIVWSGNPNNLLDVRRSVPLAELVPMLEMKEAQFFSLNRDITRADADLLTRLGVVNLAPLLADFSVSARLIGQLDLVISCDTAVPHLAGGMGKAVWVMLPFASPWCWMLEREDSPWYPTARLFRQKKIGDWRDVARRVQKELQLWLAR